MYIKDDQIFRLLKLDDTRGFNLLLDSYYKPLVLWADTFLNDIPASQDLVQDFFVTFWERKVYNRMSLINFKGYLFTSIKNAALKYIEKRDPLKNSFPISSIVIELIEPDDLTLEMIREIKAEIEKLPPRTREILKAVYIDGYQYKEVATKFNISITTVKTLILRAIKRLRDIFRIDK